MRRDDRSVILLAQPFGYGSKGHITITLKKLTLYRRHDQADQDFSLKNLGILLTDTDSQAKLEAYLRSSKCPLQDKDLRVFSFDTQQVSTDAATACAVSCRSAPRLRMCGVARYITLVLAVCLTW